MRLLFFYAEAILAGPTALDKWLNIEFKLFLEF